MSPPNQTPPQTQPAHTQPGLPELAIGVIADYVGLDAADIGPEMALIRDLGLGSLDAVEVLADLQERSGRRFDTEDFGDLVTVGDLLARLAALG